MQAKEISDKIATLKRALKKAKNKEKIQSKIADLELELKDANLTTYELSRMLLGSKVKVNRYTEDEFNKIIDRLSKRSSYSFLSNLDKELIKKDLKRKAKPVGWRFKGDNYKKPTKKDIEADKGKSNANRNTYREYRSNRSDVIKISKLETGGNLKNNQMKNIENRTKKINNIENFLKQFPNNAKSWEDATDEIRDLARKAKEIYNEVDLDVSNDSPKALKPLNFREFNKPSEWNTKGKKYILNTISKMSDKAFNEFYDEYSHWFENKMATGGNLSTEEEKRFKELTEKINAYLEGKGTVSTKEMAEHAKLKHKRNLATNDMYKKQMEWESKVEKEGEFAKGGRVGEVPKQIKEKVEEINSLIEWAKDKENFVGGYFGGTYYEYLDFEKPIEIKGQYVYIEYNQGGGRISKEKYNTNKKEEFDAFGLVELKYELSKILNAFRRAKKKYEVYGYFENGGGVKNRLNEYVEDFGVHYGNNFYLLNLDIKDKDLVQSLIDKGLSPVEIKDKLSNKKELGGTADAPMIGGTMASSMAKGGPTRAQKNKVSKVMHEWKEGELNIGKSDKKVKSQKQAVAIALSEAGLSNKMKEGGTIYDKIKSVDNWKFTNGYGFIFEIKGKKIGFLAYNNGDKNKKYPIGDVLNVSALKNLSNIIDNSIILHIQAYFHDKATKMTKMELSGNNLEMLIITNHNVNSFEIFKQDKKEGGGSISTLGLSGVKRYATKNGYSIKTKKQGMVTYVYLTKDGKTFGPIDPTIATLNGLERKLNKMETGGIIENLVLKYKTKLVGKNMIDENEEAKIVDVHKGTGIYSKNHITIVTETKDGKGFLHLEVDSPNKFNAFINGEKIKNKFGEFSYLKESLTKKEDGKKIIGWKHKRK